jgi:tetratricopeptide (TPR) repeat protein
MMLREAEGEMDEERDRLWYRFSLKMLFLLMLIFALLFGVYFVGYRNGHRAAKQESQADYVIFNAKPTIEDAKEAVLAKDLNSAIAILSTVLNREPNNLQALSYRAMLLQNTGQYAKAVIDYEAVLKSKIPQMAWRSYASLLATCPDEKFRDPERAVLLATQAVNFTKAKTPTSGALPRDMDILASAYAQQKNFAAAIHWQKEAIKLDLPSNQEIMKARLKLYEAGKPYISKPVQTTDEGRLKFKQRKDGM